MTFSRPPEPARVRLAVPADALNISAISAEAYGPAYQPLIGALPKPATEDYRDRIDRHEVWILEISDNPIGVVVLEPRADHLLVYSVAVRPAHQGGAHGKHLLDFAATRAMAVSAPELRLFTNAKLTRNLSLYRSCGFEETGTEPHPSRPGHLLVHLARPIPSASQRNALLARFAGHLDRWSLAVDGDPRVTRSSRLLPVRGHGRAAMLKMPMAAEERRVTPLMVWWDASGAAPVLAHDDEAILLERAEGRGWLADLARNGQDDEATRVLCETAAELHRERARPKPPLVPLARWFEALLTSDLPADELFPLARNTARALLADPREVVVLHGDIHHANVLDFGARGWRAIDPKGLLGERGFDYANILCNPDQSTATNPSRLARQVDIVARTAALDRHRLLRWIIAWSGLSAVWHRADGTADTIAVSVGTSAAALLGDQV